MASDEKNDPFEGLVLASDIEDEDEIARIQLEKLSATEEGISYLESYEGPLPTMGTSGSLHNPFLAWVGKAAWQCKDHAFGFLDASGETLVDAGDIVADTSLRDQPLVISLNRLRAFDYPGWGELQVVLQFAANHFVEGRDEPTQFTQTYAVRAGQGAGISGYPIFFNLRPGANGLGFQVGTVLATNEGERELTAFLQSDIFRQGLDLAGKFSSPLKMIGECASGVFQAIAKRNQNRGIQKFHLGLGFQNIQGSAKLRQGTYFAVQVSSRAAFQWNEWRYDKNTGVVIRNTPSDAVGDAGNNPPQPEEIPYNYLAFTIYSTEAVTSDKPGTD